MRTTQTANRSKQVWDGRIRWAWNGPEDGTAGQENCSKVASRTGDLLTPTALKGSIRPCRTQTCNTPRFVLRSRQDLLQSSRLDKVKGKNVRTLVNSNSLPPICASRVTSTLAKSRASDHAVENQVLLTDKKAALSSGPVARTSIRRQKERGELTCTVDLIYRSLATISVTESTPDPERVESESSLRRPLILTQSHSCRQLGLGEKDPSSNNSTVITDRIKDTVSVSEHKPPAQPLSDSEIDTEDSHKIAGLREEEGNKEANEEEVYYTTEMIAEWIISVNASLFSPHKNELNKMQLLKEEDVDTIKIIYDQD